MKPNFQRPIQSHPPQMITEQRTAPHTHTHTHKHTHTHTHTHTSVCFNTLSLSSFQACFAYTEIHPVTVLKHTHTCTSTHTHMHTHTAETEAFPGNGSRGGTGLSCECSSVKQQ